MARTVKVTIADPIKLPKKAIKNPRVWIRRLAPIVTFSVVILLWQLIVSLEIYPTFILPSPALVAERFVEVLSDGTLFTHARVTLYEMTLGLLIGGAVGTLLGYAIARVQLLEDLLSPVIVAFQSAPIVAYAPLLIIWFGGGTTSKIVTCALIVFFPALMNTIVGIRQVPTNLHHLMRSLNASHLQIFRMLEVPSAMPVLLTGLKTSATLAVIGAVVGEFVSASEGLGFWVISARSKFDTPLVIVAVITMTALALGMYVIVSLLEHILLRWQRRSQVTND